MPILTFPLSCFVGLAVGGAEVTVAGYARQSMLLEYSDDGQTIANLYTAQWPYARQSWGTIDTVLLYDAVTGGKQLASLPAATPWVTIGQNDIARIPASGLVVTYDKVGRPFGVGAFGTFGYGTYRLFAETVGVVVERTFDQRHTCSPGVWAPFNPNALAA